MERENRETAMQSKVTLGIVAAFLALAFALLGGEA